MFWYRIIHNNKLCYLCIDKTTPFQTSIRSRANTNVPILQRNPFKCDLCDCVRNHMNVTCVTFEPHMAVRQVLAQKLTLQSHVTSVICLTITQVVMILLIHHMQTHSDEDPYIGVICVTIKQRGLISKNRYKYDLWDLIRNHMRTLVD